MGNVGHWDTIEPFIRMEKTPQWIQGEDRLRVGAYDLYEAIFWTAPQSFQIIMRGQEGDPIYVPSGRQVVETAHRFMAPGMQVIVDPEFGSDAQRLNAELYMRDFAAREELYSKFSSGKLKGLMKGDWLWHIIADPVKPQDSRVSVFAIDPANYFPIYSGGDDVARVIGAIIAEPDMLNDDPVIHRTIYGKDDGGVITVREDLCKIDEWGQPGTDMDETILRSVAEELTLPDAIDQIPIYHIPNIYEPEIGWGSSEMRGIELLMRGINQGVTDEELALVLDGIGVYTTDAGSPVDEQGEEQPWIVAVGHVLELPEGKNFQRVQGVGSIQPYVDHIRYLHDMIDMTTGANDITRGRAEVAVAESGIALALRMGPILARMVEKELIVTDRFKQMLFDLRKWFAAYEGLQGILDIRYLPTYSDKLPVNKKEIFDQVMTMIDKKIISTREGRRILTRVGFSFSDDTTLEGEITRDVTMIADAEALRLGLGVGGGTT